MSTAPHGVEVRTLSGEVLTGSIVQLSDERMTLETSRGPVSLELARVAGVSSTSPRPGTKASPGAWVELVDGSALVASEYTVREGRAKIAIVGGPELEIPTLDVAAVCLQPAMEPLKAQWQQIRHNGVESDLLVVNKSESLDYHRGILRDVGTNTVHFELDGDLLPVKRGKVFGMAYYHPQGRVLPEPICRVTDALGSTWSVRTIRLAGADLVWTTPLGQEVGRPVADIARLDFSQGKIVYLSDVEPESIHWTPYFGGGQLLALRKELYAPRKDVGLNSSPLELDGKTYAKGLAIHSRTEVVYRLPGSFRWFRAQVGIDDSVRPRGNVRLIVRGDDRALLEMTVAGSEASKPLDVDVEGVRRLSILVDFGEDLDVGDHLNLCDARIVK